MRGVLATVLLVAVLGGRFDLPAGRWQTASPRHPLVIVIGPGHAMSWRLPAREAGALALSAEGTYEVTDARQGGFMATFAVKTVHSSRHARLPAAGMRVGQLVLKPGDRVPLMLRVEAADKIQVTAFDAARQPVFDETLTGGHATGPAKRP